MKALSMRQPWAWLVAHGIKDVENRSWPTKFRGEFLIHAARTFDLEGYLGLMDSRRLARIMPRVGEYELGGIVGRAQLVDCVEKSRSKWFFGKWGFKLAEQRPLPFKPEAGRQFFFESIHYR